MAAGRQANGALPHSGCWGRKSRGRDDFILWEMHVPDLPLPNPDVNNRDPYLPATDHLLPSKSCTDLLASCRASLSLFLLRRIYFSASFLSFSQTVTDGLSLKEQEIKFELEVPEQTKLPRNKYTTYTHTSTSFLPTTAPKLLAPTARGTQECNPSCYRNPAISHHCKSSFPSNCLSHYCHRDIIFVPKGSKAYPKLPHIPFQSYQ